VHQFIIKEEGCMGTEVAEEGICPLVGSSYVSFLLTCAVLTCVSLFYNLIEFLAKEKLEL
jgi:hypothetical protein